MDMSIDTHIWTIIEYSEYNFCSFDANSWKCLEQFEIVRDDAIILLCES